MSAEKLQSGLEEKCTANDLTIEPVTSYLRFDALEKYLRVDLNY